MYLLNENESFGQYITRVRYLKGLTQRKLAQISGLSNTTISRIEKGDTSRPDLPTLKLLAQHLEIDERYILNASGYMPEENPVMSNSTKSFEAPPAAIYATEPAVEKYEPIPLRTVSMQHAVEAPELDTPPLKGVRLITLRLKKNITQKELGEILGIDKPTVCQYENQISKPDRTMLNQIASFFNVSVDYLTGKTDNPNDATWRQQSPTSPKAMPAVKDLTLLSRSPNPVPVDVHTLHQDYLEIAREMQDNRISPEDIRVLMNILIKNRV